MDQDAVQDMGQGVDQDDDLHPRHRWLNVVGPSSDEVDKACQFALVLAHEHGFYSSSARYTDRLLEGAIVLSTSVDRYARTRG